MLTSRVDVEATVDGACEVVCSAVVAGFEPDVVARKDVASETVFSIAVVGFGLVVEAAADVTSEVEFTKLVFAVAVDSASELAEIVSVVD